MSLPKQVQEAANKANAYFNQGNPSEVEQEQEVVEQQAEPVAPQPEENEWKKRFTNYKKATDNTIRELRQTVSQSEELNSRNQQLIEEIQNLRERVPNTPEEALELFSEDEVDTFKKMIANEMSVYTQKIDTLEAEISKQKQQEVVNRSREEHNKLINALKKAVPNFADIDTSQGFKEYLNDLDSFGNLRMDMLRKAQANRDVERLVKFYTDYEATTVSQNETQNVNERELQRVPNSVSTNPTPSNEIMWTSKLVDQFYRAAAQGKYTNEQKVALEHDLERAIASGRFRK